jgi:hypothetical protein
MKTDVKSCTFLAAYAARQSVYLLLILKINTPKIVFQNIKEKQPQKLNPSSIDNQSRYYLVISMKQVPKPLTVNCKDVYRGTRRQFPIYDNRELQLGFMSLSDPDYSVQTRALICSNF